MEKCKHEKSLSFINCHKHSPRRELAKWCDECGALGIVDDSGDVELGVGTEWHLPASSIEEEKRPELEKVTECSACKERVFTGCLKCGGSFFCVFAELHHAHGYHF